MLTFGETYGVLKDLLALAKKAKNQEMINLATQIQADLFNLKDEYEILKDELKVLKEKLELSDNAKILEEDLIYSTRGFILKKDEKPPIPYCSFCWRKEHKLLPLSQYNGWHDYKCANCKSEIVVMTFDGRQLGREKENTGKE
ncbi:MAG: hypothetical protein K2O95_03725 [Clostridia bacterium]|nr:hypothetical protein [Clostridia bacterium]